LSCYADGAPGSVREGESRLFFRYRRCLCEEARVSVLQYCRDFEFGALWFVMMRVIARQIENVAAILIGCEIARVGKSDWYLVFVVVSWFVG
jgi:hypothetical protein